MIRNSIFLESKKLKGKEMTVAQSNLTAKQLIKNKKRLNHKDFIAGNTLFLGYNAKFKEFTYDRTPLVLILRRGNRHTLGLNFHWLPFSMRQELVFQIMRLNKSNIENDKPLQFSYAQLKPFLKHFGYAPCIRLYINGRYSKSGVVIPPVKLPALSRMRTETFVQGKHTSTEIFAQVNKSSKQNKKSKKSKKAPKRKKVDRSKSIAKKANKKPK